MKKEKLKYPLFIIPLVGILICLIFPNHHEQENKSQLYVMLHSVIITSGIWAGVLSIVIFLWKKYPWERYPLKHLIIEIILVLIYTNSFAIGLFYIERALGILKEVENLYRDIIFTNLITFLITAIHEAIEFYSQWKIHFSKSVKLEKDNIEARYESLKSQVNPHFLFNSLNSISHLVHENQPAVDYIQNLSDFLRYTLKSRDTELVLVRHESEMLEKYLQLQKVRFGENLKIEMDVPEKYFHYALPPLVLQMLIENSLKHNIISKEDPLIIKVQARNQVIIVENNLQRKNPEFSTGQGIKNIIERYRFFTEREVEIIETPSIFRVIIPLLLVEL
ncbi:MAG: histidine kinase [Bacteroidota bacterium]|nr:MAG: histidine kinase [Bacteroidota bacterium]